MMEIGDRVVIADPICEPHEYKEGDVGRVVEAGDYSFYVVFDNDPKQNKYFVLLLELEKKDG